MIRQVLNYLNNKNLKASGVQVQYTPEQAEEYLKCYDDPKYFIQKFVKIVHVDRGIIPFEMFEWQKEYTDLIHENRFTIARVARQSGKSIAVISYLLWLILFRDHQSVAILANKAQTARKLLSLLKQSYEHLPKWLQQGVVEWNKSSIELENGSTCIANSTSSTAARGGTFSCIIEDSEVTVKNKKTGKIERITIGELKQRLINTKVNSSK